jgi:pilus assembly protein Flp/PilA
LAASSLRWDPSEVHGFRVVQMLDLFNHLRRVATNRLRGDERGVVYIEYALLMTLIALVIVGGASLLGNNINGLFTNIAGYIASLTTPT